MMSPILQYIHAKLSILPRIFSPTLTALFTTSLPFTSRWRVLLLQPINILAATFTAPQWLFKNNYSVLYIPTRSGPKRCLVFQPLFTNHTSTGTIKREEDESQEESSRPLHIDIHGGGWIGGIPEQHCRLNTLIADKIGAVVVSLTYRIAPRHIYPAAHEDVNDIMDWILDNAADKLGANIQRMTIAGGSVGATLGLGICQYLHRRRKQQQQQDKRLDIGAKGKKIPVPLAFLGICPALDFRQSPDEKPRPSNYPTSDPLSFLVPLFDVYAGTRRTNNMEDARLHPILAPEEAVPDDILIVAAEIDVLLHEALVFSERMEGNESKRVECMVVEKGFHGFVECESSWIGERLKLTSVLVPSFTLEKERLEVFDKVIKFLKDVHGRAGSIMPLSITSERWR